MRATSRRESGPGPDLIPFMNLTCMLIPLLLLGASFANFSVVDSTLPGIIGDHRPCAAGCDDPLNLSVAITAEGFQVIGADELLAPEGGEDLRRVPCAAGGCAAGGYDFESLTERLALVKDEHPDEVNLVLVPAQRVTYDVLIRTMDDSREEAETDRELFPVVVIAGGAV